MHISKTPLRVSLFGGGTDYEDYFSYNSAGVIGGTIDKFVYTNIANLPKQSEQRFRVNYRAVESVIDPKKIKHPVIRAAVLEYAAKERLNISTMSDVTGGSGLGSSSSFTVGFLNALYGIMKHNYDNDKLWRDAVYVERKLLKEKGGIQDQVHAAHGGFKYYKFDLNEVEKKIALSGENLSKFSSFCILIKTGESRSSSEIATSQSSRTTTGINSEYLESMNEITKKAYEVFKKNFDRASFISDIGSLLNESWRLKCELGKSITSPDIEDIILKLNSIGSYGQKLLGAGQSGYVLSLLEPDKHKLAHNIFGSDNILDFKFIEEGTKLIKI